LHEPLLRKFREQKALAKKIARSLGRGEVGDAARLEKNFAPKLSLDHVIKERYPTFVDALRDLDDCLSLLFLFASLPSTSSVPPKTIARCQRLCHEFQHYLITTNSLRKSFLSIKGIYYQATIQGQDILWLVPYRFVQKVNGDVDYRIMATFVEFYTTLLGFVNFRLFTSIGLVYPPRFDAASDEKGAELTAFRLEGKNIEQVNAIEQPATNGKTTNGEISQEVQDKVDSVVKKAGLDKVSEEKIPEDQTTNEYSIDKFEPAAPEADTLAQPDANADEAGTLFSSFTFFISREAPKGPLEFLLRAFGCKRIAWDEIAGEGAFTHDEKDSRITHQIVDRPPLPESALPTVPDGSNEGRAGGRIPGRTYVQPQWVWDSINEGKLLRPDLYAPGATLPPHLSPWVKQSRGEYDPRASLAAQEEEGEAERSAEEDESEDENLEESKKMEVDDEDEDGSVDAHGMDVDGDDSEEADESEEETEDDFGGFNDAENAVSESEDEEETLRSQHQKELEAEAAGLPFSGSGSGSSAAKTSSKTKKYQTQKRKEEEELERQKMMMSRKKRKLLDKMMYSNKKKDEEAQKLRSKRRRLENAAKSQE
jgi:pescadillo protein